VDRRDLRCWDERADSELYEDATEDPMGMARGREEDYRYRALRVWKVMTVEAVGLETVLGLNPSIFAKRVEGCCDQVVAAVSRTW